MLQFFNQASTSIRGTPSEGSRTPKTSPSRKRTAEDSASQDIPQKSQQSPASRTNMPPHRHLVDPFFRHLATTVPSREYLEQIESLNQYNPAIKQKITACLNNIYYVITQRKTENQDVSIHAGLVREATYQEPTKGLWHSEKAATFFINIATCIDAINELLENQSLPKAIEKILETTFDYLFLHLDLIQYLLPYSPTESTKNISSIVLKRIEEHQPETTTRIKGLQLQASAKQAKLIQKIHTEAIPERTPKKISQHTKENAERLSKMNRFAEKMMSERTKKLQRELDALRMDEDDLLPTALDTTIEQTPKKKHGFFLYDSDSEESSNEDFREKAIEATEGDEDDELMKLGEPKQTLSF